MKSKEARNSRYLARDDLILEGVASNERTNRIDRVQRTFNFFSPNLFNLADVFRQIRVRRPLQLRQTSKLGWVRLAELKQMAVIC